jgi:hypothetical protein
VRDWIGSLEPQFDLSVCVFVVVGLFHLGSPKQKFSTVSRGWENALSLLSDLLGCEAGAMVVLVTC